MQVNKGATLAFRFLACLTPIFSYVLCSRSNALLEAAAAVASEQADQSHASRLLKLCLPTSQTVLRKVDGTVDAIRALAHYVAQSSTQGDALRVFEQHLSALIGLVSNSPDVGT